MNMEWKKDVHWLMKLRIRKEMCIGKELRREMCMLKEKCEIEKDVH